MHTVLSGCQGSTTEQMKTQFTDASVSLFFVVFFVTCGYINLVELHTIRLAQYIFP